MKSHDHATGCAPLMEACTLELYKKNIFRITGLPVDATTKEIARQAQKLQMLEEMGGVDTGPKPAFAYTVEPTSDEIRAALSRMKESQHRLVDEFFWYWPEKFGESKNDPAIQAMMSGDAQGAINIWRQRQKEGSDVAKHNMAIMYHMHAVDWSLYHVLYDIEASMEDQVKVYWRKAFDRWEDLVDSDEIRGVLKERIRSIGDEALTTGFARRMLTDLPVALDMINAEAALKLAERNRMDWARFHVDFMNETHQGLDDVESTAEMVLAPTKARVEQHLESFKKQAKAEPLQGASLAKKLLASCLPMMNLFDLFHGKKAHQRNDLFDSVAETILNMIVSHQKATNDNDTFLAILNEALNFASSTVLRERIIKNINIANGNLQGKIADPIFEQLKTIQDTTANPRAKLYWMNQRVLPLLPAVTSALTTHPELLNQVHDSIAILLRSISIDAHNDENDHVTALAAIQLASRLARKSDLKLLIKNDKETMERNTGSSLCFYCGKNQGEKKWKVALPMHKVTEILSNGVRYQSNSFSVSRCDNCYQNHRRHWKAVWVGAVLGLFFGNLFAPWSLVGGAMIAVVLLGGWICCLVFKAGSDGRIGCFAVCGTLAAAYSCVELAKERIGENLPLNALGGAVIIASITFWVAKHLMNPKSPEDLAKEGPQILQLTKEGWKPGLKP